MRRVWLAAALLLALAAVGLAAWLALGEFIVDVSADISAAAAQGERGDWAAAGQSADRAFERWKGARLALGLCIQHDELDGIDYDMRYFRSLVSLRDERLRAEAERLLARLLCVAERERLSVRNIF